MTRDQHALKALINDLYGPIEIGFREHAVATDSPEVMRLYLDLSQILTRAKFQLARLEIVRDPP